MKKRELNLSLLKDSFKTLKECYADLSSQQDEKLKVYIKDSCVKRFEYTYESARKIMSRFLKKEYDKTEKDLSVNNVFREMYNLGYLKNFENWVCYREKRNVTSHEYNLEKTYGIIDIIPQFLEDTEFLIIQLENNLEED